MEWIDCKDRLPEGPWLTVGYGNATGTILCFYRGGVWLERMGGEVEIIMWLEIPPINLVGSPDPPGESK